MQLIVLGMHRSGTSVLARVLNLMGAWFGPEGISTGANPENPKGFWERRDVRALNDWVLHSAGCDWNRVAQFDAGALPEAVVEEFRSVAGKLVLELDAHRPWFLKEPRLCLLLPLWRQVLEAPVAVRIHRHPVEVAASLQTRNEIPVPVGLALWEKYTASAGAAAAGLPAVTTFYDRLMADPVAEVGRLHAELTAHGVTAMRVPSERELRAFIDPDLYRERNSRKDLRAHADDPRVRSFEALQSGRAIADQDISAQALQALRAYESGLPALQPLASPKRADSADALRERLRAREEEARRLGAQALAQERENKLLHEAIDQRDETLRHHDERRAGEMVTLGELRAGREHDKRELAEAVKRADGFREQAERLREQLDAVRADAETARAQAEKAAERSEQQRAQSERSFHAKEAELAEQLARNSDLELASRKAQRQLDERFHELSSLSQMLFELEQAQRTSLSARDAELAALRRELEGMRNSRAWRLAAPLRALGLKLRRHGGADLASAIAAVEGSGLFDRAWYLDTHPDVARSGLDPVEHYLGFGAAEGRDPGPGFDTEGYLERYPDVREAGLNPLVHYALHGRQEGRVPRDPEREADGPDAKVRVDTSR